MAAAAAAEAVSVPARASAGRAGTAPRGPASSSEALPCSGARLRARPQVCVCVCGGGDNTDPHLHCTSAAAGTSSGFFFKKPSYSRQMLAAEKILEVGCAGEGAVAGRICIGCAGFRTDSCWKCRFRGAGLAWTCPSPAAGPRDAETAPPWSTDLESSATRLLQEAKTLRGQDSS